MPYTATEHVYVTSLGAGGTVVPADDPAAGALLVAAGDTISDELAEQYGLTDKAKPAGKDEAAEEPAPAPKAAATKPAEKK